MSGQDDDTELQIEIEQDEPGDLVVEGLETIKADKPKDEPADKVEKTEKVDSADDATADLKAQLGQLETRVETVTRTAAQERADNAKRLAETQLQSIGNALTAKNAELVELKRNMVKAREEGDFAAEIELQEQFSTAVFERNSLKYGHDQMEQRIKAPAIEEPPDPVDRVIANAASNGQPLSSRAQDWLREHPECCSKASMSAKLSWAHNDAIESGIKMDTDAYYQHVNAAMGYAKPAKPDADDDKPEPKVAAKAQRKAPISAPVSRDVPASNGNLSGTAIKLTRGEAAAATDGTHQWNYDDPSGKGRFKKGDPIGVQEFAKRKKALMNEGAYEKLHTSQ